MTTYVHIQSQFHNKRYRVKMKWFRNVAGLQISSLY